MPTIKFVKDYPPIEVSPGANLMKSLLEAGLPVASSCHGDGVCGKCQVQVVRGWENLSEISVLETGIAQRHSVSKGRRISCQTYINGDIWVDTTYW